jgi:hypothetical protein
MDGDLMLLTLLMLQDSSSILQLNNNSFLSLTDATATLIQNAFTITQGQARGHTKMIGY